MDPVISEWDFDEWPWFDGINIIDICIHYGRPRRRNEPQTRRNTGLSG